MVHSPNWNYRRCPGVVALSIRSTGITFRTMTSIKHIARKALPDALYLWLANRYRILRRLVAYPDTARIGVTDYDTYWDNKAQSGLGCLSDWRLRRAQVFTSLVEAGDRVLDLGVRDGALLRYMIDHKKIEGYGLDVSPKAVAFCRQQGLNVDLADINRPITDYLGEPFDYIILSEIIEHLPDPESLLNSLRLYARKAIIVSIPNTGFHQHRLRLLLGKFPLQWVVTPGEHLRFWTRSDFHWWARQMNFEIVREFPYEGTRWLKALWPGLFAAAFVYVLRAKTK
jgi:methionine biosynthesis protein MetW